MTGLLTPGVVYLRGEQLSADDLRDLDDYTQHLRAYYDIPEDAPVFAKRTRTEHPDEANDADGQQPRPKRATGINRDDHPWRGTL